MAVALRRGRQDSRRARVLAAPQDGRDRPAAQVPVYGARGRGQARCTGMRLRLSLLVLAISSLILVSFLLPLALLLRTFAADRATSPASARAQWLEPLVATLSQADLRLTLDRVNAQNPAEPTTVFLPGGQVLGATARRSAAVLEAERGSSFTERIPGGEEVLVSVQGLTSGTAVIQTFVPAAALAQGVSEAWLLLGLIGAGLLALSVAVSAQLARAMLVPLAAVSCSPMSGRHSLISRTAFAHRSPRFVSMPSHSRMRQRWHRSSATSMR